MGHTASIMASDTLRMPSPADAELSYAARQRDIKMIRAAIKKGADVNTKEDGDCPLHWAAFWGDRAVTQVLLAAGADRQATNKYGRIAAVDAQRMGHTDVVRLLFEWGADAVAETRQAGAEIAELENSKDTIGLAEYIESHRRDLILRWCYPRWSRRKIVRRMSLQQRSMQRTLMLSRWPVNGPIHSKGLVERQKKLWKLGPS